MVIGSFSIPHGLDEETFPIDFFVTVRSENHRDSRFKRTAAKGICAMTPKEALE